MKHLFFVQFVTAIKQIIIVTSLCVSLFPSCSHRRLIKKTPSLSIVLSWDLEGFEDKPEPRDLGIKQNRNKTDNIVYISLLSHIIMAKIKIIIVRIMAGVGPNFIGLHYYS